ncbi:hypothetical protein UFOVP1323_5 [uncultured Caudovirales phage]|uniref:Uncharacterized protein n=1 Tax=uncultured Caudovirales phage TaxID=2100421 RepID=A0A6J5RMF8_9CAUD|nr:hypothetical protein UFOVP1323_5 [uncultured Caudovirales phage]
MPDTALPQSTDELILPDGTKIMPDGTVLDPAMANAVQVENGKNAVALVEKMKRNLGDLPDIPQNLNPVCVILTYTAVGLNNTDIATALSTDTRHVTEADIQRLKDSEIYQKLEEMFDERVFEDEQRTARHILSKHSHRAAQKMVDLVNSPSGDLALAASRDVLRVSGVDKSQESKGMSSFKIVMVDGEDAKRTQIEVTLG